MAKRKRKADQQVPDGGDTPGTGETIETVHGAKVPAAELAHIAPHLRPFAIETSRLKQDPDNARQHGKRDLESTAASLREFGQQDLVHFDAQTFVLKVGNGRHAAAVRILEWKWIAAAASNLTGAKLRAFALAHNRTAELSTWDMEKLAGELDALQEASDAAGEDPALEGLSLDLMGFGADDLAELEESAQRKEKGKQTAAEAKKVQSVEGTLFQIVLKCGSERHQTELLRAIEAKDPKALVKLLNGVDVRSQAV